MKNTILVILFSFVLGQIYSQNISDNMGRKQGIWIKKNKKGQLISETEYLNDTLNGILIEYDKKGRKLREQMYLKGIIQYHILYNKKNKSIYRIYDNGMLRKHISYYKNGSILLEANFLNNTLHGDVISYYKTGQLRSKIIFEEGKILSCEETYDQKGNIISRAYPNSQRDKFIFLEKFNKKEILIKSKVINIYPFTYFIFPNAHRKGLLRGEF